MKLEKLLESTKNQIKLYAFDWDDNLQKLPTKIHVLDDNGKDISVSTEEFAEIRHFLGNPKKGQESTPVPHGKFKGKRLSIYSGSYKEFDDSEESHSKFINDVMNPNTPKGKISWPKLIVALKKADPIAIITARGHSAGAIKIAIKKIIEQYTLNFTIRNIIKNYNLDRLNVQKIDKKKILNKQNKEILLDVYLDNFCFFYPVSNDSIRKQAINNPNVDASNPSSIKVYFLAKFRKDIKNKIASGFFKLFRNYTKLSMGFSDDDEGNIQSVTQDIEQNPDKTIKTKIINTNKQSFI